MHASAAIEQRWQFADRSLTFDFTTLLHPTANKLLQKLYAIENRLF